MRHPSSPPRTSPSRRTRAWTILGFARRLINTARGKRTQGGSTITQQYVKNYYLSQALAAAATSGCRSI
ncbi:transglycosylase domain-containing protein [Streptomyces sp. Mo3]|uniref:transglycosylase domain-containing protein n=1 Tax=Streptomyces sp. Mo3 TaxID=3161190 RepID=UPI0039EE1EBE